MEYESLGMSFADRGAMIDEQIQVLRRLWTEPLVHFEGRFHRIIHAGLNPMPLTRPIPIWLGGTSDPVIRRVGRTADGWMPLFPAARQDPRRHPAHRLSGWTPEVAMARMRAEAAQAGRDPAAIGLEGRITYLADEPDAWRAIHAAHRRHGASHLTIMMRPGLVQGVDPILAALAGVKDALAA